MTELRFGSARSPWLSDEIDGKLSVSLRRGVDQARRNGRSQLISLTAQAPGGVDPTAVVAGSRAPDEPWFCFEQPDHGGAAVAALGCVRVLEAHGPARFAALSRARQKASGTALIDAPAAVPGSGLIAAGGFALPPRAAPHRGGVVSRRRH
jgi:hypothetical protein